MTVDTKNRVVAIWGFAFLLVFFGLFTGRVNLSFFGEHVYHIFPLYAHAAELGQIACLFAVGIFAVFRPVIIEKVLPYLALILLTLGYSLTLYQAIESGSPSYISSIAGALFGAGQGACFMTWFMVYARMKISDALKCMVISTILSGVILFAMGFITNTTGLFSVLLIVVAGCASCMFLALRQLPEAEAVSSEDTKSLPVTQIHNQENKQEEGAKSTWSQAGFKKWLVDERRALLSLIAIAFVCGAQRVVSLEGFLPQEAVHVLFPVGYIVGAAIFWKLYKNPGFDKTSFRLYSVLLIVMATCGLFSAIQIVSVQVVLYAVINIAFCIVSICMAETALRAMRKVSLSPLFFVGIICGSMYFSIQFGRMVCFLVSDTVGMDATGIFIISVIIIYVVALAAISMLTIFRKNSSEEDVAAQEEKQKRTVITVASVSEEQLKENPIYKQQFGLTDREMEILVILLAGYNATDIAKMLTISVNTVKTHLKNIYVKMGVHNRRDLIDLLNEIEHGPTEERNSNNPI
ncbi:MAG: helix-turn-helix domain-containing protein [Raoultibacter sp.]